MPSYETVIRPLVESEGRAGLPEVPDEIAVGPFMEALYASNWA